MDRSKRQAWVAAWSVGIAVVWLLFPGALGGEEFRLLFVVLWLGLAALTAVMAVRSRASERRTHRHHPDS